VFFFDEAHLLFDDAPKALVDKVEQVARLIRSKGVGVYFITQNPPTCPKHPGPAGQPGAARAARLHRQGPEGPAPGRPDLSRQPALRHRDAIREVGTGEAVTSFLEPRARRAWSSAR
jgi:uncharacterized protein